jgi:hypothetical protein
MRIPLFKKLHAEGLVSDSALQKTEALELKPLLSLYWELRLLLYLGVLLLTGGLGILVYKNIDSIGHQAVLAFIALITAGSFYYCLRKKAPFSWEKISSPDPFFDYILLLGCLSLLIFLGYLQYEYDTFGDHYGLATFIPMMILFIAAYYFDHLGVLSLAITNLAAWAGIAITPLSILKTGNFADDHLIYTGIILAVILLLIARLTQQRRLKPHFETTYTNFGMHLFFIAALTGFFTHDTTYGLLWFLGLAVFAVYAYIQAMARQSFYFILVTVLYSYIALSALVVRLLSAVSDGSSGMVFLGLLYFILSALGTAVLLVRLNRQLKPHDSL